MMSKYYRKDKWMEVWLKQDWNELIFEAER